MTRTLRAKFDGEAFHPEEPLPIPPDTTVLLTVEMSEAEPEAQLPPVDLNDGSPAVLGEPYSFLKVAMSLNLEGPPDWSENLDEYLYHGKKFPDD